MSKDFARNVPDSTPEVCPVPDPGIHFTHSPFEGLEPKPRSLDLLYLFSYGVIWGLTLRVLNHSNRLRTGELRSTPIDSKVP